MFNKKWLFLGILSFLFIVLVSILATLKLLPSELKSIPFYDTIGHFVLFGLLGLFAHMALNQRFIKIRRVSLPIGPTIVALYAIIDELLQILFDTRSFDLFDLGFGLLGIFVFTFFLESRLKVNK